MTNTSAPPATASESAGRSVLSRILRRTPRRLNGRHPHVCNSPIMYRNREFPLGFRSVVLASTETEKLHAQTTVAQQIVAAVGEA